MEKNIEFENRTRFVNDSDVRASMRRKIQIQNESDREFAILENIYRKKIERQEKEKDERDYDRIAEKMADIKGEELREKKIREGLRENSEELRNLRAKLQLAIVSQTRENQINEQKNAKQLEENQKYLEDQVLLRRIREEEKQVQQIEELKRRETRLYREQMQNQQEDNKRRQKLLEVAQRVADKERIEENLKKEKEEYYSFIEQKKIKQEKEREEMNEFLVQRKLLKDEECRREQEEKRKMEEFVQNVDERLLRAIEEQKVRDAERERLALDIGNNIRRKAYEREQYEQLCIDLAYEQELKRLKEKELQEAQKIQKQIEECRRFMIDHEIEKNKRLQLSQREEEKVRKQMIQHAERLAKIAEIEQEENRIRAEKYRHELEKQMIQRKELFEAVRIEELRKLKRLQEIEQRRQIMIEEERRKLVIEHIMSMGPESIRFLPKGVLKEDDLDYLPKEYIERILRMRK